MIRPPPLPPASMGTPRLWDVFLQGMLCARAIELYEDQRALMGPIAASVLDELRASAEPGNGHMSDCWSSEAERLYFGAAAFHGLTLDHWPDIYSYALEAGEALREQWLRYR